MKISLNLNPTMAIRAGHENFGEKIIDIDISLLSKEQREELISSDKINNLYNIHSTTRKLNDVIIYEYEILRIDSKNPDIIDVKKILNSRIELRKIKKEKFVQREKKLDEKYG